MGIPEELFAIARTLDAAGSPAELKEYEPYLDKIEKASSEVEKAFCGSWLGYHSRVYYEGLNEPPAGANFSQEWGLKDLSHTSLGSVGRWVQYKSADITALILSEAGNPDLEPLIEIAAESVSVLVDAKSESESIFERANLPGEDKYVQKLIDKIESIEAVSVDTIVDTWRPKGAISTRDTLAAGQRFQTPPHIAVQAQVAALRHAFGVCINAAKYLRQIASHLQRSSEIKQQEERIGTNVFIGHGRAPAWLELKDFVRDRLHLPYDEFNRVPVAGITNQARLNQMLDSAAVALIIMTAEDENDAGVVRARMNVIHEVGLFQGRLGFTKAIVLLEQGCEEFSNIEGLGQIRFPAGNIRASFEEVRRVLEREGLVS